MTRIGIEEEGLITLKKKWKLKIYIEDNHKEI